MTPTRRDIHEQVFESWERVSEIVDVLGNLRRRPMLGGAFGNGRFDLASTVVVIDGLHSVRYFVIEVNSGSAIGGAESKREAIALAREAIQSMDAGLLGMYFGRRKLQKEKAKAEATARINAAHEERLAMERSSIAGRVKSISRRRKRIFDESEGKCHYCATALTLDGKWHIEHKMPRALGGGDEPGNLVASCAPCNHEKRDTTDVEYKAKRAAKTAREAA